MTQRGAVNLTVSSIVVIIFAVTMLGLGLAFIRGSFSKATDIVTFPVPDIPADADTPIVLPFETLKASKGQQAEFSINFYNNGDAGITAQETPAITACAPSLQPSVEAVGQTVPVGGTATYKVLLAVPAHTASQKYTCNLQVNSTSKQFFLEVR